MAGTRFSALTDFRPEKNRFLDRAKTVYLKATHKTEDITFYWIEQRGVRGRNDIFPPAYKSDFTFPR